MSLALPFLQLVGAGAWSLDRRLAR
jgi:hypothetical protein